MTVSTGTANELPVQEQVVEVKNDKPTKPQKIQYYRGTLSSPFAMEVIAKMGFWPLPEYSAQPWHVSLFNKKNCPIKASNLRNLQEFQRHSRFPESEYLTKKNKLAKSFRKATKRGVTGLDFLPQTYVLPDDWKAFMKRMNQEKNESEKAKEKSVNRVGGPWILKPHDAAGGHGISLVQHLSDVGFMGVVTSKWNKLVVSQYIANPLLIEGLKFDMRLYVLVTSFTPLHIYFFSEGLARFCTEKYPTDGNITNLLAHLTNTSLNCHSDKFAYSDDINDKTGHTRSLATVFEHLQNEGVDTNKVMLDIRELVIKTFTSIQPTVEKSVTGNVPFKRNCYQLFGLDVLLDDHLKPWLLEVNGNPSLEPYTAMEIPIKTRLVRDMFRVIGLHGEEDVKRTKKRECRRKGDFTLIFPRSIAPKSGKKRGKRAAAFGFNWDEYEGDDVAPVIPEVQAEQKVEEKVEEKVEVGMEGKVDEGKVEEKEGKVEEEKGEEKEGKAGEKEGKVEEKEARETPEAAEVKEKVEENVGAPPVAPMVPCC